MEAETLSTNLKSKLEAETSNHDCPPGFVRRSLPSFVPMLLISLGYVDPGKWVASVEGGARFGFDLMAFTLIFNFAAIFCQYISARIGVITERDLAQICSDEYDTWTCMLLGIQAELSVIMLDLNMILGMAQGLNLIFGWDLLACVFLTATGAIFHIVLAVFLDIEKTKILGQFVAGFVLLSFIVGLLINQPEIPLSMNGILIKLNGESAFVLMSLLGATLVPHNFYLHSSIVQWHQDPTSISKDALCHNHFLTILCVFSGLYLVNNMLMTASANEFYSMGPVLLTFQDALSPLEQVLRSPIVLLGFVLILFLANQTTALTWSLGGEAVVHGFLKLDIPGWLHYATIRVIAVVPALYCVWSSGAEGMYQLLIFTQVLVALQLPSSVIPLFRVAMSRSIMGPNKVSQSVELLALIIFIGMLGLNIVFVIEMIFGNSDWVGDLRWNAGNGVSVSYLVLLTTAFTSLCSMLWLAVTPLKSANVQSAQAWNRDMPEIVPNPSVDGEESYLTETRCHEDASVEVEEPAPALATTLEYSDVSLRSFHPDLPETIMEPDPHANAVRENHAITSSASTSELSEAVSTVFNDISDSTVEDISDSTVADSKMIKMETGAPVEKTLEVEADANAERDADDGDSWETEESSRVVSESSPSLTSDGPASFRSISGKGDEGGNSFGSLSRIEGLGRAARRQLAAVLDEFWGKLYDFHGLATHEARAKKIDDLLGLGADSRPTSSFQRVDACGKDYSEYSLSVGGRTSDTPMNASSFDSSKQPRMQSNSESPYGLQRSSSSSMANPIQLLDAYVQRNVLDSGERRYSSVRNLHSSQAWDYQPATIHGYETASYLSRGGNDRNSDNVSAPMQLSSLKTPSVGNTNYRDSLAFALGKKLHNGSGLGQPPGFENVSRNSQLQSERSQYDFCSSGPADNTVSSVNTKKYHSLPDISGYSIPHRAGYVSNKNAPQDGSLGYGSFASKTCYEPSLYSNSGSRTGAHLVFDELSQTKLYRETLSSQLNSGFNSGSLWSRQPYEQFGLANKIHNVPTEGVGSRPNASVQETTLSVDIEGKLLQAVRLCIMKLLKLEGSDWLFRHNDGTDEELIDRVAAREKFVYEIETREMNHMAGESRFPSSDRKSGSFVKNTEANSSSFSVSSVPNCGDGCVWRAGLVISFGVWCIHRILDLSLMESRPELWGKYTYVLNRLQGIIDPAFSKPRSPLSPCFCLQVPTTYLQQKSSPHLSLPPTAKPGRGKCTTPSTLLELIKDVEVAISSRKGRTGTAAGDVAFPKGKENLASVLKRYKRRLSSINKPAGEGSGLRKMTSASSYS
ncbi:ethylene-insensitive protein 2.2-like [Lotus japonicus]|uniref:ethylene-insensitive protein 2.2-like n=1 Tax=Lotus japonicus TaxID=34305 RepID=UPI00258A8E34|nr:ethylene-insensitive protein 2.2-like [Lotus japonicus]